MQAVTTPTDSDSLGFTDSQCHADSQTDGCQLVSGARKRLPRAPRDSDSLVFTDKRVLVDLAVVVVPLHVAGRGEDGHAVLLRVEPVGLPGVPLWCTLAPRPSLSTRSDHPRQSPPDLPRLPFLAR